MRTVFLGNDPWSVPTLDALLAAEDVDVRLVVTNPPRPAGRGSRLRSTAVADAAHDAEADLLEVAGLRTTEGVTAIEGAQPDAIVVVAYGELLTAAVLDVPPLGTVNLHFSLLPRWRGAAPVQRAILEGDEVTGVSVMLLDAGLDTGPVLIRREVAIEPEEDAGSLGQRLALVGAPLVLDALRSLDAGTAVPIAQDHGQATDAAKLTKDERAIDWTREADSITRRVRALAPAPGATTGFRDASLKILRARARIDAGSAEARATPITGEVLVDPDGTPWAVAGGGTQVCLLEVAPSGKPRMPGADWARGARIRPGERVG